MFTTRQLGDVLIQRDKKIRTTTMIHPKAIHVIIQTKVQIKIITKFDWLIHLMCGLNQSRFCI